MKKSFLLRILMIGILACSVMCVSACSSSPDRADLPSNRAEPEKPTIPEDVAAGTEYLYDFKFAERYDKQITDDFSFVFPSGNLEGVKNDTIFLLERYKLENIPVQESTYDSDGMQPHKIKDYCFSFDQIGKLYLKTDFYEPDRLEYVRFVWTDIDGTKTNLGVGVGSSEKELLIAYTDSLYYLDKEDIEPVYFALEDTSDYDFEYAYTWQPFTTETNEIRDITFYVKDGTIVAVEMVQPFELRYVYGLNREASLQKANENRQSIIR